ncbi:hypothetical protein ACPUEF_12860, partial [Akkermansia muciniphila]|uniref:hypothetical protein n=1 Tax=Akkermansia muciniphila TaxID=239935 RepID=UPI003EBC109B
IRKKGTNNENFLPTEKGQTAGLTSLERVQKGCCLHLPGTGLVDSTVLFSQGEVYPHILKSFYR